jgi:hypothetical protein
MNVVQSHLKWTYNESSYNLHREPCFKIQWNKQLIEIYVNEGTYYIHTTKAFEINYVSRIKLTKP